jgi:hypothetical protein
MLFVSRMYRRFTLPENVLQHYPIRYHEDEAMENARG